MDRDQQFSLDLREPASSENSWLSGLRLNRPVVFLDLETTGLDTRNDRIVQIALIRVNTDRTIVSWSGLVDPGMPIPPEATAVHGIHDGMVKGKPVFGDIAGEILDFIRDSDLAGFNIARFDLPMLQSELSRCGKSFTLQNTSVLDAQVIFHKMEPRNLEAAYRFYCNKHLEKAHDAAVDVRATLEIFNSQLSRYSALPQDVPSLHAFCNETPENFVTPDRRFYWRNGEAVIAFGKYRSKPLKWILKIDPDYLQWMRHGEFSDETKAMIENAFKGRFPEKNRREGLD
ncbi:3'-5' exonuclease [bacterium]|nr:3'-5' exonuclease [bacterium]